MQPPVGADDEFTFGWFDLGRWRMHRQTQQRGLGFGYLPGKNHWNSEQIEFPSMRAELELRRGRSRCILRGKRLVGGAHQYGSPELFAMLHGVSVARC